MTTSAQALALEFGIVAPARWMDQR